MTDDDLLGNLLYQRLQDRDRNGKRILDRIVERYIETALSGEAQHLRELISRIEQREAKARKQPNNCDLARLTDEELAQFERLVRKCSVEDTTNGLDS